MTRKMISKPNKLTKISQNIRNSVIKMAYLSKTGETGSSLSIIEILTVLYFKILKIDPKNLCSRDRDIFILSKGHGAAALYATLAEKGIMSKEKLESYRINGGNLHGHPCKNKNPEIEVSSGSLGHGLSIGAGMSLVLPAKRKVYVLIGDGECNEGSIWEAAMFIGRKKLPVVAIIDFNNFQGFGKATEMNPFSLKKQWQSFGWEVLETDGHDTDKLEGALKSAQKSKLPTVVIAKTIIGKGVPKIENLLKAHYFVPDEETFNNIK